MFVKRSIKTVHKRIVELPSLLYVGALLSILYGHFVGDYVTLARTI